MKKFYALLTAAFLIFSINVYAQCSLYPVSLANRINSSSLVIEGKVISQQSFWNTAHNYIYTSSLVQVGRVMKGSLSATQVEIITEGGEVGMRKQTVEPSLQLKNGDEGVFTLNMFEQVTAQFGSATFRTFADAQGFIKYDLRDETAREPFRNYNNIGSDLYPQLEQILGTDLPDFVNSTNSKYSSSTVASVTGITPLTITAGTSSVITISGSGFGSTQGTSYVEFYNADDGGSTYIQPHSSQYVSWSNTQIQVMVPARAGTVAGTAGTGPVRVTVASSPTLSAQTLTVDYGELNLFYSTNSTIYNTRHVDLNGSSGITWQMYTSFDANTSAKTAFLSAFQTWRCNTYINWVLGSTTTTNVIASDGINIVRFDVSTELPSGVLGRCTSYFSGCISGSNVYWFVDELDICFDDPTTSAITWQFGPSLASGVQYDFESVALHELGHGHQLSHVINSNDVMHYALSNAQNKRSLITQNINGGNDVMSRNISTGVCGMSSMVALNSSICSVSAPTASFNLASSTVCVGQSVSLTDLSTNTPSSWSWTMTGGSPASSTVQNTSTAFSSAGLYSISLIATNGFGSSAVLTRTISVVAQPTLSVSSATICSGTSTMLTASGAASYTWNPGVLSGASQNLNPSSTTVYTLNGSNGTCSGSTTSTITVISTPTLNVSNASICSGASTLITASGATSYTWNPGNLTGSSQNFNPSSTTVYTVSCANGGCSGTDATFTITVNTTPTVAVPDATICSGTATLLIATGATNYTWNPGNLTGASQNLSPASTATYTVTGGNGACSATSTLTVSVNTSPTITVANASICSGSSTLLTASGSTTYTWNPGNLTGAAQNLNPGSTTVYTVSGNIGSCSHSITTTVNVTSTPTLSAGNASICSGTSTLMTVSGASSYLWNPGGLSGASQNLSPGSTTVYTITGANGTCTSSLTSTVNVTTTPTITAPNAAICSGNSTLVTASGSPSYTWNPGNLTGASQNLNPASTIVYTISGNNGTCTHSITITVNVTTTPTLSVGSASICSGTSTLITASGAGSYIWDPGNLSGASQNLNPMSTTIYTITGSIGTCSSVINSTVNVTTTPTVVVNNVSICSGTSTLLTATGATSYVWNPGNLSGGSQNLNPASTTIYTVTGTIGTCTSAITSTINVTITPTITVSNGTLCTGSSIVKTVSGAANYTWNPGNLNGATQTLSPTSTTTYTITGANGVCANTQTAVITVYSLPSLFAFSSPSAICNGGNATIAAGGGATYTWNPGNLSGSILTVTPNASTMYTVTASDATCVTSTTVFLQVNPNPTITIAPNYSVCSGSSTVLTAGGATSYSWNPGSMGGASQTLSPLSTTVHSITGSYSTGCTSSVTTTLTVLAKPNVFVVATPTVVCTGITSTLGAGGALTYSWSPGSGSGPNFPVTPSVNTTYTVTGFDANCSNTAAVSVSVNPNPSITISNWAICSGNPVSPSISTGGATSFTWNPGYTGVGPNPSATTVYTVTGMDANGCSSIVNPTVYVSPTPTLTITRTPTAVCQGHSSTLTATGANTYTWFFGSTTGSVAVITPTLTGSHFVSGQTGSCVTTTSAYIVMNFPPAVFVNAIPTVTLCSGNTTTLQAGGANTYTWNPSGATGSLTAVSPATSTNYTVTGTGAFGCTASAVAMLTVFPTPTITIAASQSVICLGNNITLTASGANNYTWMPGFISGAVATFTPGAPTLYQAIGTTGICTSSSNIVIIVNPNPSVSASAAPLNICSGTSASLTGSGASTYSWNPGGISGNPISVSPNTTTTYTLTGFNSSGCSSTSTVMVSVSPSPTLNPIASPSIVCSGKTSTLSAGGATGYTWSPGAATGQSIIVTPNVATLYMVTGVLGNCTSTANIVVLVNPSPTVVISGAPGTVICGGDSYTLNAMGGATYTWMPGNLVGQNVVVNPVSTTVYTVTGSSAAACIANADITVSVIPIPTISIAASQMVFCEGVTATLTASGASGYTWNPGNLTGSSISITPSGTTNYTVDGNNANCNSTSTVINIQVNPTPTVTVLVNDTAICMGDVVSLLPSGAANYTFSPGNLISAGMTTVNPVSTTVYTVNGELLGCFGTASATIHVSICDGISAYDPGAGFLLYPNPARDIVTIDFGRIFSGELTVFNAIGQMIAAKKAHGYESMAIELGTYSAGVYLLKISDESGKQFILKLVKE